jgi:peptidoglycan hydrolase CwlO-like protein
MNAETARLNELNDQRILLVARHDKLTEDYNNLCSVRAGLDALVASLTLELSNLKNEMEKLN